ncbi:unnamed protein product [Dovyalis caffra]|uniref:Uncharacterized protein n=1 Tax=Dovyalis caffra TaxID=77055 RepID=A0AAV1SPF5_9ROSI|nr:unnamed protein product [Dovyalis caffra]
MKKDGYTVPESTVVRLGSVAGFYIAPNFFWGKSSLLRTSEPCRKNGHSLSAKQLLDSFKAGLLELLSSVLARDETLLKSNSKSLDAQSVYNPRQTYRCSKPSIPPHNVIQTVQKPEATA